jgi:adenylate cyclase
LGSKSRFRIRFPIAMKLVVMAVFLLTAASAAITYKIAERLEEDATTSAREENLFQAVARAESTGTLLNSYVAKARIIASLMLKEYPSPEERQAAMDLSFFQDPDLVSLRVARRGDGEGSKAALQVIQTSYLRLFDIKDNGESYISTVRSAKPFPLESVFAGNVEVRNSSLPDGVPLMTIGFPLITDDSGRVSEAVITDIRLDRFQASFSDASVRLQFLIDKEGNVLAHPDDSLAAKGENIKTQALVGKVLEAKTEKGEMPFINQKDGETYFGAYSKNSFGVIVVSQVSKKLVLEPAVEARNEAIHITGLALSAALFFVFLFSMTLSTPIERLLEITHEIAKGNFDVRAQATVHTHDEVGELAQAFDEMTGGLRERDKIKKTFSKFHGSTVADDILAGDNESLRGTSKEVTVFFSDIRDFTAFSEGHTPEEVVEMLNEYFEIMVGIVTRSGGVVDKFIGDAIMAVWGAPRSSETDAESAMGACLEMRKALADLNLRRLGRGKTPIRIGMGLHTGNAISGTIGSTERMEYTVIGDTVNMAARIEAATKSFGTDLLISAITAERMTGKFLMEKAGDVEVKGKSEPLSLFKVRGFIGEDGVPVLIRTEYSDYEATGDEKVKIAS